MEGTQPSAAGGDGAPTAMVAVPGLSGALTQAFPLLGGSGTVSMEASLRLRAKDYAAHDRWLVNLQDVITSNRLDDLWENQQVPTLAAWPSWKWLFVISVMWSPSSTCLVRTLYDVFWRVLNRPAALTPAAPPGMPGPAGPPSSMPSTWSASDHPRSSPEAMALSAFWRHLS